MRSCRDGSLRPSLKECHDTGATWLHVNTSKDAGLLRAPN